MANLLIDPDAQRTVSRAWVNKHVPLFDVDQLGYPVVNRRADGNLYVIDGGHRISLMRAVGWGDQRITVELFEGLTQADEAALFIARSDRKAIRLNDKFRIGCTARDPECLGIRKIVADHGMVISDQQRDGHIVAVSSLIFIYRGGNIAAPVEGPAALTKALRVMVGAWGKQASAVSGVVIQGIGMVFLRYKNEVDGADLIKKLAKFPAGPTGLHGKARGLREMRGRSVAYCAAFLVVDLYNRGRRTHRLEGWDEA